VTRKKIVPTVKQTGNLSKIKNYEIFISGMKYKNMKIHLNTSGKVKSSIESYITTRILILAKSYLCFIKKKLKLTESCH